MSANDKVHYKFHNIFLHTNQEILSLEKIFQNVHSRFPDALGHLQNHPASIDDTEITTLKFPNSQVHFERNILSELGEIIMSFLKVEAQVGITRPQLTI